MLSELCVQVMRTAIFVFFQFRFLEDVGEFLPDQVFLLLVKYVDTLFYVIKPRMVKYFFRCEPFRDIFLQHVLHQVTRQLRDRIAVLNFLLVKLMGQITNLIGFERNVTVEDSVKADACGPDIHWEALVSNFLHDFRRNVGRSATLFK